MEKTEKTNLLKEFWPQITAIIAIAFMAGTNVNSLEGYAAKLFGIEKEHEHDIKYLNEEDNGVRADFERADDCEREISKLENKVLYWKIKYETSNSE